MPFDTSPVAASGVAVKCRRVFFPCGWYAMPEFGIFRDYERDDERDMLLGSEIGYSNCGTTYFVFPGIGIDKKLRRPGMGNRRGSSGKFLMLGTASQ